MAEDYAQIEAKFQEFLRQEQKESNDEDNEYWIKARDTSDYAKKVEYLTKGMQEDSLLCTYDLGMLYLEGKGIPKDLGQAEKCFQKAVEFGSPAAMMSLGQMYLKTDTGKAYDLICKAATIGDISACLFLREYISEDPRRRRPIEARLSVYFQELEHKPSLNSMDFRFWGWCYATGICCQQDLEIAEASWLVGMQDEDYVCQRFMEMFRAGQFPLIHASSTGNSKVSGLEEEVDWEDDTAEKKSSNLKAIISIAIGIISMSQLAGLSVIGLIIGILAMKSKPGVLAAIGLLVNAISMLSLTGYF